MNALSQPRGWMVGSSWALSQSLWDGAISEVLYLSPRRELSISALSLSVLRDDISWGLDLALGEGYFPLDALYQHCRGLGYVEDGFLGFSISVLGWGMTILSLGAVSQPAGDTSLGVHQGEVGGVLSLDAGPQPGLGTLRWVLYHMFRRADFQEVLPLWYHNAFPVIQ